MNSFGLIAVCRRRAASRPTKLCEGFTLIELLVVLAVTALLSGILILYSHTSRQQVALYVEEAKLVQLIIRAKSLSLATYRQSSLPICGYGVHINYNNTTYALFSYPKPGGSSCSAITSINPSLETIVSSFSLSRELAFVSSPPAGSRIDDFLFIPPDPIILINSNGSMITSGFGNIVLTTADRSLQATITVSSAGQITF